MGERTQIENAGRGMIINTKLKQKKNNNDNWSHVVAASGGSTHHGTIEEEGKIGKLPIHPSAMSILRMGIRM